MNKAICTRSIVLLLSFITLGMSSSAVAQCPEYGVNGFNGVNTASGHPFEAEAKTVMLIASADGIRHNQTINLKIFRDEQGRVRIERFYGDAKTQPTDILIYLGCGRSITLNPSTRTANKHFFQARPHTDASCQESRTFATERGSLSSLGTKNIAGVRAYGGIGKSYASPEAMAAGSPPIDTYEHWCSPELNTPLDVHTWDSKSDISITFSTIKLTPPTPALFEIPSDYSVVSQ